MTFIPKANSRSSPNFKNMDNAALQATTKQAFIIKYQFAHYIF